MSRTQPKHGDRAARRLALEQLARNHPDEFRELLVQARWIMRSSGIHLHPGTKKNREPEPQAPGQESINS